MSTFQMAWRINPKISGDREKWQSFLSLIDRGGNVADEVILYVADDTYPELSPMDDKRRQAEACRERFADLRARGIKASINVWPAFNLYDVERKAFPNMRRMVGIDGEVIENLACPTSEEFIRHMSEKYEILATAEPDAIWIDDDFRFTHLGGCYPCFCDGCVSGFEGGRFKSREYLAAALALPENRDLRISWSSWGADRLANLCRKIREAVDRVNPKIDLGLMTVGPSHTTFSGDYIKKCMSALRSHRARPGHFCYSDREVDKLMWKSLEVARQTSEYPSFSDMVLWEEDSYPQGYLNKSRRTRRNEITLALMCGCGGVAFNHTSMNGGLDEKLAREVDELHAHRPRWEKLFDFAKDLPTAGALPYYSWFMTAKANPEYAWLKEDPFDGGKNLDFDLGIPGKIGVAGVALTADKSNSSATFLSGKTVSALDGDELERIFSGNVYMDGEALLALEEMGGAELAGVKVNPSSLPNKPCILANHPFCGEFSGHLYRGRHELRPKELLSLDGKAECLGLRAGADTDGERWYISKYENALGGRVVVNGHDAWEYMDSPQNLYLLASILEWFDCPIRLRPENAHAPSRIQPYIRTDGKRAAVALVNASLDESSPYEALVKCEACEAFLLNPDGTERRLAVRREGEILSVSVPEISPWDIAVILLR